MLHTSKLKPFTSGLLQEKFYELKVKKTIFLSGRSLTFTRQVSHLQDVLTLKENLVLHVVGTKSVKGREKTMFRVSPQAAR